MPSGNLFDAYAHGVDWRDAEGQKALFTVDTRFSLFMEGEGTEPTSVLEGRESLTLIFADLNRYDATTHFNRQSTVNLEVTVPPASPRRSLTTSSPRTANAR